MHFRVWIDRHNHGRFDPRALATDLQTRPVQRLLKFFELMQQRTRRIGRDLHPLDLRILLVEEPDEEVDAQFADGVKRARRFARTKARDRPIVMGGQFVEARRNGDPRERRRAGYPDQFRDFVLYRHVVNRRNRIQTWICSHLSVPSFHGVCLSYLVLFTFGVNACLVLESRVYCLHEMSLKPVDLSTRGSHFVGEAHWLKTSTIDSAAFSVQPEGLDMAGEIVAANAFLSERANTLKTFFNSNHSLRLFTNDVNPKPAMALSAFSEATFPGYARVNMAGKWKAVFKVIDGEYQFSSLDVTFAATGASNETVYGWMLVGGSTLKLSCKLPFGKLMTVGQVVTIRIDCITWAASIL